MKKYVILWVFLLALLGVSLVLGHMGNVFLATLLIFAVAILKAVLVAFYYMGLKWEPRYVMWILLIGVCFMIILGVSLIPDIVWHYGR